MARTVQEVMTHDPRTVQPSDTLQDAAKHMRDGDVGAVLVCENDELKGIVTDRDIVVRAVADGRDPAEVKVGDVATTGVKTVNADQSIDEAIKVVRESDVRRVPVVQDGKPVGILSLGDLAIERDSGDALADISSAAPNN